MNFRTENERSGTPQTGKGVRASNTRRIALLLPLAFLLAYRCSSSSAIANLEDCPLISLGAHFERKPWVRLPMEIIVPRILISPDGSEVWCIAGECGVLRGPSRARAFVFDTRTQKWECIPSVERNAVFHDVAFSQDGKTTWISMSSDGDKSLRTFRRQSGSSSGEWTDISPTFPGDSEIVERFWILPNGTELWASLFSWGLVRADLNRGSLMYFVESECGRNPDEPYGSLIADYVQDIAFTSNSQTAICAASGGDVYGITKIRLSTNETTHFRVTDAITFERLVVSPNDQFAWCIGNHSYLWCLSIESEQWAHKLSVDDGMPIDVIDSLVCAPNSQSVWIAGSEGVAEYALNSRTFASFVGESWKSIYAIPEVQRTPLVLSADGKYVVAGHSHGMALFDVGSGRSAIIASPDSRVATSCSAVQQIGVSPDFLCVLEDDKGVGGLFLLNMEKRHLIKLFETTAPTTALSCSSNRIAWISFPGLVYQIDVDQKAVMQTYVIPPLPSE